MTEEKKPDYAFGNYHADVQQDDPDDVQLMTPEESAKAAENVREMMETRPNTTATRCSRRSGAPTSNLTGRRTSRS
jgi:hypothetical protein